MKRSFASTLSTREFGSLIFHMTAFNALPETSSVTQLYTGNPLS